MKGIRGSFEYFANLYPSITKYARKARYLIVLSWVIIGRRLGLPNEITEMIKRVIEAKRVLKSFQKKKDLLNKNHVSFQISKSPSDKLFSISAFIISKCCNSYLFTKFRTYIVI
jgi:hypothetical protein